MWYKLRRDHSCTSFLPSQPFVGLSCKRHLAPLLPVHRNFPAVLYLHDLQVILDVVSASLSQFPPCTISLRLFISNYLKTRLMYFLKVSGPSEPLRVHLLYSLLVLMRYSPDSSRLSLIRLIKN